MPKKLTFLLLFHIILSISKSQAQSNTNIGKTNSFSIDFYYFWHN